MRSLITVLMLFKSSPNRRTARRNISISVSVHFALRGQRSGRGCECVRPRVSVSPRVCVCVSHPAGLESHTGWSCIVNSPSLVKAAPAAEKISPT